MLIGPGYAEYRDYLTKLRNTRHGMAVFDHGNQASANRNNTWIVFARFDQQIEGDMLYQLKGDEATHFNLVVPRFYYHTPRARYLLLDWIARHVDQADRAEIWLPPTETPELWLSDLKMKVESTPDMPMARVLDIEQMGGMEVGEGSFTIKVTDPLCPWNEGSWQLQSHDGKLVVSKTSQADCALTIQGLTGLIMGTHDPECFSFRGWGQPSPDVCVIQQQMFPQRTPHIHEMF
jgi:predicted acetyltransferase